MQRYELKSEHPSLPHQEQNCQEHFHSQFRPECFRKLDDLYQNPKPLSYNLTGQVVEGGLLLRAQKLQ